MLIRITQDTAEAFDSMAPDEIFYPPDKKGHYLIGEVGEEGDETVSRGLLIFEVDEENDTIYAQLSWLYVAQAYRGKGVAEELMTEFYRLLNDEEITDVFCDVPFPEEYNELCAFLENWGFEFWLRDDNTFMTTLGQAAQASALKDRKACDDVRALQTLTDNEWKRLTACMSEQDGAFDISRDAYEQTVSCALFCGDVPYGGCLVQVNGGGQLVLTVLRRTNDAPSAVIYQMLVYSLNTALEKYGVEKEVRVECRTAKAARLVTYFFPDAQPALIRSGRYVWDEDEEEE